ncbi:MAG: hypothetical protein ACUVXA_20220 [Candidatus Jordarchaeum sp.]|uniref:hypothetical protein n=1 Tax=Candidatus Jordarchaeum sp. TaxID=2823881 RepID=UPI00404B3DAA
MDKLCQFFGFLPKNVIDAHAEQYHLDRYAKKIHFRHFIELAVLTLIGEKKCHYANSNPRPRTGERKGSQAWNQSPSPACPTT